MMNLEQTKAVSSDSGRTYELVGELGRGGFGAVYKARHTGEAGFARLVAIKMLHDEGSSRPEYANRLRDEARLLSRLRHRAIVAVDDLVCLDGRWAVVLEYVEGEDLLTLIRRGPLPPRVATEIALEVASGLRVIHGAKDPSTKRLLGIVHRDLKPSNIRVTPHGEVKLLDFGIARAAFPGREAVTGSVRFESVGYVAPERMFGLDTAGSDIFSLGVVFYECLTGLRMGPLPERQGAYEALRDRALAKLDDVLPDPSAAREVLTRMLAFEDRERPAAAVTVDLLRDLTQDLPGPWLASWASELLGRSRYGDPEDYAAAGLALPSPASTESLAVIRPSPGEAPEDAEEEAPLGPPPTIGLSLPAARAPAVMDALVPAPEDMDSDEVLVAPVQVSEEAPIFSRPPAPPPPPATLAVATRPPSAAPAAPSMSEVIPPLAGWFLGTAAALLLLGVATIAGIAAWRPDLLSLSAPSPAEEPASPAEEPAAPVEIPVTAPIEAPPPEPAPEPAPEPPAPEPVAAAPAPAEERPRESTRAAPTSGKSSGTARPKATTAAPATANGRVLVRGNFDKAELEGPSGRIPAAEAPPGTYRLRVRFGKELAWVETGLSLVVTAGQTTVVECSYESEACRISR